MSASLVGSEMCIRDRISPLEAARVRAAWVLLPGGDWHPSTEARDGGFRGAGARKTVACVVGFREAGPRVVGSREVEARGRASRKAGICADVGREGRTCGVEAREVGAR
eukprot:9902237-Alexandrium_andersonii.AAC.1